MEPGWGWALLAASCRPAGGSCSSAGDRRCSRKLRVELGEAAIWEAHDILKLDEASKLVKRVLDRVGPLSILVNNAGIHIKKSAIDLTPEEFHSVLADAPGSSI